MDYKYNGIILSKFDVGEVDRIYSIYTLEAGKIRILGKGVRNTGAKLAGQMEPVTSGEIFVAKTRGRGKIIGAIAVNNFLNIKADFSATSQVFYVFGILDKMIAEEERDEKIFHLVLEYLLTIEKLCASRGDAGNKDAPAGDVPVGRLYNCNEKETQNKIDILTVGFLFKFLDFMGYKINVEKCMNCGRKLKEEPNYFSAERGGFLCSGCQKGLPGGIKSTGGAIKLIRIFLKNNIKNFAKISAPKVDIGNAKIIVGEMLKWITG